MSRPRHQAGGEGCNRKAALVLPGFGLTSGQFQRCLRQLGPLDAKLPAQLQPLQSEQACQSRCVQATPHFPCCASSSGSTKADLFWAVWGGASTTSLTESSSFEWTSRLRLSEVGQLASGSHTFPVSKPRFRTTEVGLLQDPEP